MEIKKICILDQIINEANKHEQKDVTCSRCKGQKKLDCYKEIQRGVCYKCGGSGKMPNKWKAAKQKASQIKEAKTRLRSEYKDKHQEARSETRKQDILEMYQTQLESLKAQAYELAKKSGISN